MSEESISTMDLLKARLNLTLPWSMREAGSDNSCFEKTYEDE
jgi:hypothetical protein